MAARWTALLAMLLDGAVALAAWMQAEGEGRWVLSFEPGVDSRGGRHALSRGRRLQFSAGSADRLPRHRRGAGVVERDHQRVGFFHFNLMWMLAGTLGVFLSLDLLAFFFFWELMLIPMFLIAIWGHEHRIYAAVKFFLFTQASGLLMLVSIVGLYVLHGRATGTYTFRYDDLLGNGIGGQRFWLMLGFFVAFAVKLPAFPFHTWLADAHTEAPTAGSLILAGLLLKTGAYGLVRFVVPLFPEAAADFAPVAMAMGVVGMLLRRDACLRAERFQAAGRLHQRQPHGLRAAGRLRVERDGGAGRADADDLPRGQHRRAVHHRRRLAGAHAHARSRENGRAVVGRAEAGGASGCCSRWLRSACRAWAISSASSWCSSAPSNRTGCSRSSPR